MFRQFRRQLAFEYNTNSKPPSRYGNKFTPRWFNTFERHSGRGFQPGPGGKSSRFFGRGDVKFALLELLQERPMHGYEMMKALEEKSDGFYVPSAGTIYPTLQLLQDRGFVTVGEAEGKKIYHITETGQNALKDRQKGDAEDADLTEMKGFGRGKHHHSPELHAIKGEVKETIHLLMLAGRTAIHDPAQMERLRRIIKKLRQDLAGIVYDEQTSSDPAKPGVTPPD